MHVFTHSFDYIVIGVLIACMLFAAAKAIPRDVTHSGLANLPWRYSLLGSDGRKQTITASMSMRARLAELAEKNSESPRFPAAVAQSSDTD